MENKKKIVVLVVLMVALFGLGIAFANYTFKLRVTAEGTYDYTSNNLPVEFEVRVSEYEVKSARVVNLPTNKVKTYLSTNTTGYDVGFEDIEVEFNVPGSSVTLQFNVSVKNSSEVSPGLIYASSTSNASNATDEESKIVCKSSHNIEANAEKFCTAIKEEWLVIEDELYNKTGGLYTPLSLNKSLSSYNGSFPVYYKREGDNYVEYNVNKIDLGESKNFYLRLYVDENALTDDDRFVYCTGEGENQVCEKDVITVSNMGGTITFYEHVE